MPPLRNTRNLRYTEIRTGRAIWFRFSEYDSDAPGFLIGFKPRTLQMNSRRHFLPEARLSLAPMLDLTDRHLRYFLRTLSRHLYLYTEMISTGAIIFGSRDYLRFDDFEHPVALQLGGSDPHDMAKAARIGESRGYDEININAGCPSSRVQAGTFGAVLMKNLPLLSEVIRAVKDAVSVPVTVKTRLGVDDLKGYDFTFRLVSAIRDAGADGVIIHARNACLDISPRDNREKPPLDYEAVYRIKQDFPELFVGINGNIMDLESCGWRHDGAGSLPGSLYSGGCRFQNIR